MMLLGVKSAQPRAELFQSLVANLWHGLSFLEEGLILGGGGGGGKGGGTLNGEI